MTCKYEVQFKDGSGAWRRWSLKQTPEAAQRSLKRLQSHLGPQLVSLGYARIIEAR